MNDTKELIKDIKKGKLGLLDKSIILQIENLSDTFNELCSKERCHNCTLLDIPNICLYITKLKECINYE